MIKIWRVKERSSKKRPRPRSPSIAKSRKGFEVFLHLPELFGISTHIFTVIFSHIPLSVSRVQPRS